MGVNNQVAPVGIIGGTGLTTLSGLEITGERVVDTPWGEPSSVLVDGLLGDQDFPQQLPGWRVALHTVPGAGPDIALFIHPEAVRCPGPHFRKQAFV